MYIFIKYSYISVTVLDLLIVTLKDKTELHNTKALYAEALKFVHAQG